MKRLMQRAQKMPAKSFDTALLKQLRIELDETAEAIVVVAEDQCDVVADLGNCRVQISNHQNAIEERAAVSILQPQIVHQAFKWIARSRVGFEERLAYFQQQLSKRHAPVDFIHDRYDVGPVVFEHRAADDDVAALGISMKHDTDGSHQRRVEQDWRLAG